jgi:hypothetical protein
MARTFIIELNGEVIETCTSKDLSDEIYNLNDCEIESKWKIFHESYCYDIPFENDLFVSIGPFDSREEAEQDLKLFMRSLY